MTMTIKRPPPQPAQPHAGALPERSRAMPPVRTLLFLVPLVKALRPSTTPAKQLSTASSMKARVASQKAAQGKHEQHKHTRTVRLTRKRFYSTRVRTGPAPYANK